MSAELRTETSPDRAILSWYGLFFTLPVTALFLVESLVIKLLEIKAIEGNVPTGTLLQSWAPDLAFGISAALLFGAAFSWSRPRLRIALAVPWLILMAVMMGLYVASYGFFMSTGANLSWSAIEYWYVNYEEVSRVVAGEGKGVQWRFFATYAQVGLALFFVVLAFLPPVRRRLTRTFSRRTSLVTLAVGLAASLGLAALPRPAGPSMAAGMCVPLKIVAELVDQRILPEGDVEIAASERLDASIEVEKDPSVPQYNVVLILYESLRWKSSDAYFPDLGATPFMAELAGDGLLVEHQYTVLPHTTKAVMPVNCGIYPYLDTTPKETVPGILPRRCLAHILRAQGYKTAFFQPAGNFEHRPELVANMGYEVYRGLNDLPQEGFEDTNYFGKEERIMLQPSLDWVDSVREQGPFLLTYLTLSTHHNYMTPQSHDYVDYPVENDDLRNYMNAVRYTDDFFRDLFQEFDERGLLDNTLFVIVGDHGEAFGEHGGWQHDLIQWEEGLRTFGLLYAPGIFKEPGVIKGWRSHLDVLPTVCDALGLELTRGSFVGTSWLTSVPDDRTQHYSCWYKRRCLALREGPIKTIYHFGMRPMEVYDNSVDPFDEHNLAYDDSYGDSFLREREERMLHWARVVNQQYEEWEEKLAAGAVSDIEPPVSTRLPARFGDAIELVGYEVGSTNVRAGDDVRIKYVFKALRKLESSHRLFVHVLPHKGRFINADHVPGNGAWPLEKWSPGQYIIDEHIVHIPGTWQDGEARVTIGFWDKEGGGRFPVSQTEGDVDENRLVVTTLEVRGAVPKPVVTIAQRRRKIADSIGFEKPAIETPLDVRFDDAVALAGVSLERMDVTLAGTVEMTYLFQALKDVPRNWSLTVELVREDGRTINGDHVPINGLYPLRDWRPNEYVTDRHRIHIDMHRERPGTYEVWLGVKAGRQPVPATGSGEIDDRGRVHLGSVTIRRGPQKK